MSSIQQMILQNLLSTLIASVDKETIRHIADRILDAVEERVENSDTPVDDAILLPLVRTVRLALDIPDNDEGGAGGGQR